MKEGKVPYDAVELMNMESLSYMYGWTPKQILEMPVYFIEAYKNIANARADRMKDKDLIKGK